MTGQTLKALLPPTNNQKLLFLILVGCSFIGLAFIQTLSVFLEGDVGTIPIGPLIFSVLFVGLWRVTEWARKLTTSAVIALSLFLPLGIINPFNAMEILNPPPVWILAGKTLLPALVALLYCYAIGRYKDCFRKTIF